MRIKVHENVQENTKNKKSEISMAGRFPLKRFKMIPFEIETNPI